MNEQLKYTLIDSGTAYQVSGYDSIGDGNIVIPSSYNSLPVTTIGLAAFEDCADLLSVIISDGVTRVGEEAFFECVNLTSVNIPESVTAIYGWAFGNCSSLTSVIIPSKISQLGTRKWAGYVFGDCGRLETVIILSPTPPYTLSDTFEDASENLKIYVPEVALNAYKTAPGWQNYADKIVSNDLGVYFMLNANATKAYVNDKIAKLGEIPKYQHNVKATINDTTDFIGFNFRSASSTPITYADLRNPSKNYPQILLYSCAYMVHKGAVIIESVGILGSSFFMWVFDSTDVEISVVINENSTITDTVTEL